jgi:hypothetical protein
MSIKCGRCGDRHETVQDVRACFNGEQPPSVREQVPASERCTAKQAAYLQSLLDRAEAKLKDQAPDELSKRVASLLIDGMKRYLQSHDDDAPLPAGVIYDEGKRSADGNPEGHGDPNVNETRRRGQQEDLPQVPAGRYAVPSLTGNNDLDFFKVDRPDEGRWKGYTFVKRVIGGRPESPVRGKTARAALAAIASVGPQQAAWVFGQELGQCWRCGRHLTDEESRRLSIGPDCRGRAA